MPWLSPWLVLACLMLMHTLTTDFASHYPPAFQIANGTQGPPIPQAWLDKLASIKLPEGNPVSTLSGCCSVSYNGKDGMDKSICSFTAGCHTDSDLFAAPDGTFVLTFDDGPTDASPTLYTFLEQNKINNQATHFMIGGNIAGDPKGMQAAFNNGGHLAVHTWSHHYMTALSNEAVLGELGWTMQIIADLSGGRVPAYWRPPYGDTDNRVRAIAEQVFGMKTVLWNRDTNDWAIGTKDNSVDSVSGVMEGWFKGPKSPGILALEHELNNNTVDVFIREYPHAAANGWVVKSVADAFGFRWYQNAMSNTGEVAPFAIGKDITTDLATSAPLAPSSSAPPSAGGSAGHSGSASGSAPSESASGAKGQQASKNSGGQALVVPGATVLAAALLAYVF